MLFKIINEYLKMKWEQISTSSLAEKVNWTLLTLLVIMNERQEIVKGFIYHYHHKEGGEKM